MEKELNALVKENKIKWLPWVGEHFEFSKNKILIIGESHYYNPNESNSFEKHQAPNFTNRVISEMAIPRDYYSTKIYQNFHRAMFGNDEFETNKFWNLVSFYNFIQKPMNTNKGRPTSHDFYNSWSSFHELIQVLKPSLCIFIGTTAADSFNEYNRQNKIVFEKVIHTKKIGQNYAKKASVLNSNIPIHFIKHASQYFSWSQWHEYLKQTIPSEINWLEEQIKS